MNTAKPRALYGSLSNTGYTGYAQPRRWGRRIITVSAAVSAILAAGTQARADAAPLQPQDGMLQPSAGELQGRGSAALGVGYDTALVDGVKPRTFEIPAQPLVTALVAFSAQADIQFAAPGRLLAGIRSQDVKGTFAPGVALQMLLQDSGFTYRVIGPATVAISASDAATAPETQPKEGQRDSSRGLRVADAAESSADPSADAPVQEITVTATRREESVLDVPYNISAVTPAELHNAGADDVEGLSRMIPGLQAPNEGLRGNELPQFTIRGLNVSQNGESSTLPGGEAPLVSMYSDDTPLVANLKTTDLARVEVLRGPQSTLYGSGSVGGTVRLIHNQPDTTRSVFQVNVDVSHTQHASDPSGSIDTIFNIPISDSIALRGSAGWEGLAGYTDALSLVALNSAQQPILANPSSPLTSGLTFQRKNGIDDGNEWYARLTGLWKFNDATQATLTYQHQQTWSGGFPYEQPGLQYEQNVYVREAGSNDIDLASLDVSAEFGFATLSSTSSFTNQRGKSDGDVTGLMEELSPILYGNYPRMVSPIFDHDQIETITEELRVASNGSGPLSWVAGVWYSYQFAQNSSIETIPGYAAWAALPGTGSPPGCTVYDADACPYPTFNDVLQNVFDATPASTHLPDQPIDGNYSYYAHTYFHDLAPLYGEISYHITPHWQVTAGGRLIVQKFSESIGEELPICGAACSQSQTDPAGALYASSQSTFHKQVYKANTSYEVAPDTLLYYTWSQGFRRGGANGLPYGGCLFCVPASQLTYQPDLAVNNEVGIKGRIAGAGSYTFTLYNINWQHPQISGSEPVSGLTFIGNANRARSRGVETELTLPLSRWLRVLVGYAYTDATITSDFNVANGAIIGVSGDRLPGVSKQQSNVAVDFSHPLTGDMTFKAYFDVSHRSDFWTETPHSQDAALLPGYTMLDARAGVDLGSSWGLEAYLDNITNAQGISAFSYTKVFLPHNYAYLVARPRTVGINVRYTFKGAKR